MTNKRTCLYDKHVALGALITPFAGFDMPIQYTGIIDEHNAVREHCGVFDVSHMGEVIVSGPDADKFINHIFTNDVNGLAAGKVLYGMICYPDGGVVDDTCICKLDDHLYLMTINASNIDKDVAWIEQNAEGFDVVIENKSEAYGQLAIQGPKAESMLEDVLGLACKELKFYEVKRLQQDGTEVIVSRTGYTGEDGFEVYGTPEYIVKIWDKLIEAGVKPCGLGCRDTLRLEAGMPLYGHEMTEETLATEVTLKPFIKLEKEDFIGKKALETNEAKKIRKGFKMIDRGIARDHDKVFLGDKEIGYVTTGTSSPSLKVGIGHMRIDRGIKDEEVFIEVRGKKLKAKIVPTSFLKEIKG